MQNIINAWFTQGMIKATSDAWLKGWDERNGGNLTLRLDAADIAPYEADFHAEPRYIALSQPMPLLANTAFIVTGSGKFFRNVQLDPAANLGVVKVDSDGAGYHILWGLTNDAVPTSELPAHFLSHSERIKATNGKDRVIMHCHATNLIALTYVLENTPSYHPQAVGRQPSVWWSSRMASAFCRGWCRVPMKSARPPQKR
jgi:rhamnulose-1-phosphate aldolase